MPRGRFLTEADLEAIALGAAILGTGGGGNPYLGKLRARELLRQGKVMEVISMDDLQDSDTVYEVGGIGAPMVGIEKFEKGDECLMALRAVERQSGRPATALISSEIGGSNALEPLIAAAYAGLPVVDGDGMGRAFPEVQMTTFMIYGVEGTPAALADEKGNSVVLSATQDAVWLERLARSVAVEMGAAAGMALAAMSGAQVRETAIPGTLTLAQQLGEAVLSARAQRLNPVQQVLDLLGGTLLFQGKVTDVDRRLTGGFVRGQVQISGLDEFRNEQIQIDLQNENLVVRRGQEILASVPDLIILLDLESGEPITTEVLRFGFRVAVLGVPAHPKLKTEQALKVVGPRAFGYDHPFVPLSDHRAVPNEEAVHVLDSR